MKKYILLTLTLCILISKANSAAIAGTMFNYPNNTIGKTAFKPDTIKYLRDSISGHRERFQHKELNVLLNKLHLKVKSYMYFQRQKRGQFNSIVLYFNEPEANRRKLYANAEVPALIIDFEEELSDRDAFIMFTKSMGLWLDAEKEYYGKRLVKNIKGVAQAK